jgi:hypothetical protein
VHSFISSQTFSMVRSAMLAYGWGGMWHNSGCGRAKLAAPMNSQPDGDRRLLACGHGVQSCLRSCKQRFGAWLDAHRLEQLHVLLGLVMTVPTDDDDALDVRSEC